VQTNSRTVRNLPSIQSAAAPRKVRLCNSSVDVHRSENEYLVRGWGIQNLRDRSSFPNFPDLIVIEADELTKKPGWLGGVVRGLIRDPAEWK